MDTHIDLKRLEYSDLVKLGELAVEALELAQDYDQSRSRAFCKLLAACNVETLKRRKSAERHCGTAVSET